MTKLSDSLRAAADRAPLDGAQVPVDNVARRVRLQRGLRTSANGVVGAGAVAVLAFGVATPFLGDLGAGAGDGADALIANAERPAGASFSTDEAAGTRLADWGTCGTYPLEWIAETGGFELAIPGWGGGEFDGGDAVEVPVAVTPGEPGDYTTSGPIAVVLWDGMVVATAAPRTASIEELTVGADSGVIEGSALAELVNCFNGEPLPAADYELLVSQQLSATELPQIDEPVEEAASASSESPEPAPSPSLIGGDAVDPDAPVVAPTLPVNEPVVTAQYRAVAPAVAFTVAGDKVEDPFAEFLPEPWTPPALPEGAMSPEVAREQLKATMSSTRWDMAPGTSRILPSWGFDAAADERGTAPRYGCSWDGTTLVFPTTSSTAEFVDVAVEAPASINVSYGWIVDGNPEVSVSVTNTSDYDLPGFYNEPGVSLYLVDSRGTVVAEGYPTSLARYTNVAYAADGVARQDAANEAALLPAPANDGYLKPGDSISGDFVWRDVSGCGGDEGSRPLEAGAYTLVSAQYLYFQNWGTGPVEETVMIERAAEAADTADAGFPDEETGAGASRSSVASDDSFTEDWLEVQVWTSHGTVRVTTN